MIIRNGRLRIFAVGCLVALGSSVVTPSAAEDGPECADSARVFAVAATTGHLAQIRTCQDLPSELGSPVEVDSADWRTYSAVFGAYDGDAAIVYAVTPTGELWWRRQATPDVALGPPVRVAGTIDWRHDVVFAAKPGYLALGDYGAPLRILRHDGWASGGTEVSEDGQLFTALHGPRITAMAPASGYAIGVWGGVNYRVWREPDQPGHDDTWYASGELPAGVSDAIGDGTSLYGVDSGGGVVRLWQSTHAICRRYAGTPWLVRARVPGHFSRVVVPAGGDPAGPPVVEPTPPNGQLPSLLCGNGGSTQRPWEWQ
jgi:hypothetical protein